MKWSALLPRLLPFALLATAGCGGQHDEVEKQLSELRSEVAKLRAREAALAERLDAIDLDRGTFAKHNPAAASAAPDPRPAPIATASVDDRPALDVVRLSPSEGDGDADNDPNRPVVRAVGNGSSAPPTPTLSNKNLGARGPRKSVTPASSKDKKTSDADARMGAKP